MEVPARCWPRVVLAVLATALPLSAQSRATVAGRVTDAESGQPLPGTTITVEDHSAGTTSDLRGRFVLARGHAGHRHLRIDLIGYEPAGSEVTVATGDTVHVAGSLTPSPIHLAEMLVQADRAFAAASSRAVRESDLQVRPRVSAHQMLQMAPGLIIAQHAGGGKAEQIFLRNFDADHGTDVAISVDGMPVNMVSHGHGQGYADLHFLIPDVVADLEVDKGPYFARHGNLATAGAIRFQTKSHLDDNVLRVEGGSFGTVQYTALYQLPLEEGKRQSAYFAGSYYRTDGPIDDPQSLQRLNVSAKVHTHLSERSTLTLDAGGFSSAWNACGQIPRRAVGQGLIGRFGSLDPLEGGTTGRQSLNLAYQARGRNSSGFTAQAYYSRYDFKLFSDFTFRLHDPLAGDMIEQVDDRALLGLANRYTFYHDWGRLLAQTTLGGACGPTTPTSPCGRARIGSGGGPWSMPACGSATSTCGAGRRCSSAAAGA